MKLFLQSTVNVLFGVNKCFFTFLMGIYHSTLVFVSQKNSSYRMKDWGSGNPQAVYVLAGN